MQTYKELDSYMQEISSIYYFCAFLIPKEIHLSLFSL